MKERYAEKKFQGKFNGLLRVWRKVSIGQGTFEIIPEDMITRAGLLAAAEILKYNSIKKIIIIKLNKAGR